MTRRILLALFGVLLWSNLALGSGLLVSPCGKTYCGPGLVTSPTGGPDPLCNAMSISDAEIAAWCVVVGGTNTSAAETGILSTMAAGIKADLSITTLSQKFDRFSIYALGTRPAARVDLATRITLTENGAITWTTVKGYTGNGSSMYLDTGLNSSLGGNYTQNLMHYGAWVQTAGNNAAFATYVGVRTGVTAAQTISLSSPVGTGLLWASNTNSGNGAYTYGNTVGLYAIDRTNSTTADFYSAGVATGNHDTGTTAALNNKNFLVLANWNAALSAVANFSNGTVAAFTAGTSLGAAGQLAVFNRMHTALNALSAANFP